MPFFVLQKTSIFLNAHFPKSLKQLSTTTQIVISSILFTFNCGTDSSLSPSLSSSIIGAWDWTHSKAGWTGEIYNPESLGYRIKMEFDNRNIVKIYRNDVLFSEDSFSITSEYLTDTQALIEGRMRIGGSGSFRVSISNDTLITDESPVDGPVSYYKRIVGIRMRFSY